MWTFYQANHNHNGTLNASFHKSAETKELIEAAGCTLRYLYSPDPNLASSISGESGQERSEINSPVGDTSRDGQDSN